MRRGRRGLARGLFVVLACVAMVTARRGEAAPLDSTCTLLTVGDHDIDTGGSRDPERSSRPLSVLVHLEAAQGRKGTTGAARSRLRTFATEIDARVHHEYDVLPTVVNVRNVSAWRLEDLERLPGVNRVEEDYQVRAYLNDSTPLTGALQSQIDASGVSATGSGVRICIVDTGIDSDHLMYAGRIDAGAGFDFVHDDANPEDDEGHGSHVAGIAAGGAGLSVDFGCVGPEVFQGLAPEATLIGMKVLDSGGSGLASDIIAGIDRCTSAALPGGRADVINLSLGGGAFTGSCDGDVIAQAVNNATAAGVVVVAAAGNEANTNALPTPACASSSIAAGATYDDEYPSCEEPTLDSFTFCIAESFGECLATCTDTAPRTDDLVCFSNLSDNLDVTAPGCLIYSADPTPGGSTVAGACGTSMSSAQVAGLAALLLSADPTLSPSLVRQAIRDGAVDLGPPGFDSAFGFGRIDVINSLGLLSQDCADDARCDDGLFCTGVETCDSKTGCHSGADPCLGRLCSEAAAACVECLTDADCDDRLFCTGVETCGEGRCHAGTPVRCDDGVSCTTDTCNESAATCDNSPADARCDDGLFCTGVETCDSKTGCHSGADPCLGRLCSEAAAACVECLTDADCDDRLFCTGVETCAGGSCVRGAIDGFDGLVCELQTIGDPGTCAAPLPRGLQQFIDRQVGKAEELVGKAERRIARPARERRIRRTFTNLTGVLDNIRRKMRRRARKRNVAPECTSSLEARIQSSLALLPALQP